MKTELVSFAVTPGMESEAEAWMRLLKERRAECVATLDREKMRYESVFKSEHDGRMYLSWFSVQGEDFAPIEQSPFEIDRLHIEYWDRCIDPSVPPLIFEHVVSFAPDDVESAVRGDLAASPYGVSPLGPTVRRPVDFATHHECEN